MTVTRRALFAAAIVPALRGLAAPADILWLKLRTRKEIEFEYEREFPVAKTAILICDMWDRHWCTGATKRVDALAQKMAPVIEKSRARGIRIIHSPSETMDFYARHPARLRMLQVPPVEPPRSEAMPDPPLPIDDSDGGCDTGEKPFKAWTRQHPLIRIADEDAISDEGRQVYSYLHQQGVYNLLVMGVHTNMCVLNRTFAIKQMVKWGMSPVLVRDLTDAMYDPKDRPFVSHDQGTELVIQYIEKHWCPSTLSEDLLR